MRNLGQVLTTVNLGLKYGLVELNITIGLKTETIELS